MTDGVVELYPGGSVLPLTMKVDGVWLQDLWGPEYILTDDSIVSINAILSDPNTTVTKGLGAIGVLSPDPEEKQSRGEKSVRRGELPDPLQVAELLRALGRHGFSARETLDNSPTLIKNPENILAQVREAEEKVEIGSNVVITAEMLVAGIIGNRVAVDVPSGSRTPGKPRIQGEKGPKKLTDEVIAFLEDPSNHESAQALLDLGYKPSDCVIKSIGILKFIDIKKNIDFYDGLTTRFPELESKAIKNFALIFSKSHSDSRSATIFRNFDAIMELSEQHGFDGLRFISLRPHIMNFKPETFQQKFESRVERLQTLGLSKPRVMNLISIGALRLEGSDAAFEIGFTVLTNLRSVDISNTSDNCFDKLIGNSQSTTITLYCALQDRDLNKVNLSEFYSNANLYALYREGGGTTDMRRYIEENRDRFANSPVHQRLLELYDTVRSNAREKSSSEALEEDL